AEAETVRVAELGAPGVVGGRGVPGVVVDTRLVAERAEAQKMVRRLPGVAAERVAHEVAGENDAGHRIRAPCRRAGARTRPRRGSAPRRPRARAGRRGRSRRGWPPARLTPPRRW